MTCLPGYGTSDIPADTGIRITVSPKPAQEKSLLLVKTQMSHLHVGLW